jgi:hypothetical protein
MASRGKESDDENYPPPLKRFRKVRSREEEQESLHKAIPRATQYKNKWAVNILNEWRSGRQNKIAIYEPTSFTFDWTH